MAQPLVSIIVPVYNGEKTIERCLRSIQNQSYSNIEEGSVINCFNLRSQYSGKQQNIQKQHNDQDDHIVKYQRFLWLLHFLHRYPPRS